MYLPDGMAIYENRAVSLGVCLKMGAYVKCNRPPHPILQSDYILLYLPASVWCNDLPDRIQID